jgi:hypothetical protein
MHHQQPAALLLLPSLAVGTVLYSHACSLQEALLASQEQQEAETGPQQPQQPCLAGRPCQQQLLIDSHGRPKRELSGSIEQSNRRCCPRGHICGTAPGQHKARGRAAEMRHFLISSSYRKLTQVCASRSIHGSMAATAAPQDRVTAQEAGDR